MNPNGTYDYYHTQALIGDTTHYYTNHFYGGKWYVYEPSVAEHWQKHDEADRIFSNGTVSVLIAILVIVFIFYLLERRK